MASRRPIRTAVVAGFFAATLLAAQNPPSSRRVVEERIESLEQQLATARQELAVLAASAQLDVAPSDADAASPHFFEESVGPILQRRCFACHGPLRQRGNLRLDSRPAMLIGGSRGAAIVPGDAEASLLVAAIRRQGDLEMPPPGALDPVERQTLEVWIEAGAAWPDSPAQPATDVVVVARDVPAVELAGYDDPALDRDSAVDGDPALDSDAEPVRFNRDVRPLLADRCFRCHGPDEQARQAGLRLDTEEGSRAVLPSGRRAIVVADGGGDLRRSQLFQRIAAHDELDRMPPTGAGNPLDPEQIRTLARWIQQGAAYQRHWAFVAPERPTPPSVATAEGGSSLTSKNSAGWPRNDIDRFVLARLQREGVEPAPEADRRTLLRRLSLDLTGLPPSPEEVESFLVDQRPDAVDRQVDRLLASPRYGEHMARYWLDAARYADTNGYHIDNERFMWRWRDWVIDAFNGNQPFDQFTVEQLAGDLLEEPTAEQLLATGFHRNHMINFEGGAIPEEYRTQYVFDRTDTTATVWLGLTAGCAKCHDHKFDPLTQSEYYQLTAFFNTVAEQGLDGQAGNADPLVPAPTPSQRAVLEQLEQELGPLEAMLDSADAAVDADVDGAQRRWQEQWRRRLAAPWQVVEPTHVETLVSQAGADFTALDDHSWLVSGENPDADVYELTATVALPRLTALRLEALTHDSLPDGGFGRATENGSFVLTELEAELVLPEAPFEHQRLHFGLAYADHGHPSLPIELAIDGDPATGWSGDFPGSSHQRTAVFVVDPPVEVPPGAQLVVRLRQESSYAQRTLGRFRLALSGAGEMTLTRHEPLYANGPFLAGSAGAAPPVLELSDGDLGGGPRGGPSEIDLDATYADGRRRWVPVVSGERVSSQKISVGPGVTFLHRRLVAPSARSLRLEIAAESWSLWRDGELVAESTAESEDPSRLELDLPPGPSTVLVRVLSERGGEVEIRYLGETLGHLQPDLDPGLDRELAMLLATQDDQRTREQTDWLRHHYRRQHWIEWQQHEQRFETLTQRREQLLAEIPTTMVMAEMQTPRPSFLLQRGQYDAPGAQVQAGTPSFLPSLDGPAAGDRATRLDMARWLVDPAHPLTARVVVNRIWQRLFGTGLVKTSADFGTQGEWPSHPELLDWLATELVRLDWDLQALQKTIVLSATYRQSSRARPELMERDPGNRLLARGARFRVDAETIRDSALLVSGLLVERVGGPSVKPYQPPGLWKEVGYQSDGRFSAGEFRQDSGESLYRRSLYTFWKRTVPPPNMMVFDAPNRETCTVRRSRSNTPLQALTLLNDPQFVEAQRTFAEHLLQDAADTATRIDLAYRRVLSRPADEAEIEVLRVLLAEQRRDFEAHPEAAVALVSVGETTPGEGHSPAELAAWTTIAGVVFNLDEALTRF